MKKALIILLSLPFIVSARTTETTDSINSQSLQELMVEGATRSTSATVAGFIPSSRQKKASKTPSKKRSFFPSLAMIIKFK